MRPAEAAIEPALRVLAMLRGVLKMSLNLDVGYRSAGSAFLRRAGTRSRAMFPAGEGRWCARVLRHRHDACVRDWTRVVARTRRSGQPVECTCHAGLTQISVPVRRRGRMVGMLLGLQAPRSSAAGGFDAAWARVRDLPGSRREWRADFDRLPALPPDRIRSILELCRDMTEAVLVLSSTSSPGAPAAAAEVMARAESPRGPGDSGTATSLDLASRARRWIDDHPESRGGRADIAAALGCSPVSLSRQFKRRSGLSMPAYANRMRIGRARELLAGTAFSIADIAARSGFGTRRQFLNVFRSQTGVSPRRFRRARWEEKRDA